MLAKKTKPSFALIYANINDIYEISYITGNEFNAQHLRDIGFINGVRLQILTKDNKGYIIKIYGNRIAIDSKICKNIYVTEIEHGLVKNNDKQIDIQKNDNAYEILK